MTDEQPSTKCECGGYIGWTEHPDRWEGSCYGLCAGYPVQRKAFKMPNVWSEELGLPNVGPIWKDYPITKAEFLARQVKYGTANPAKSTG